MATALGIAQLEDGTGTDPLTLRRIIQGRWANPGIVCGLEVAGGTGLTYSVSAGCAVTCRAETDGCCEAYFPGGATPAVAAGDPSSPRVDLVWLKSNDPQQGDADNTVVVGVTSGSPSPSPVAPDAPAGCLPLASMLVPAGATSTGSAQPTAQREYAIPYGASLGLLAEYHDTTSGRETAAPSTPAIRYNQQVTLPTDRLVELELMVCARSSGTGDEHSNLHLTFWMDGEVVENAGGETRLTPDTLETIERRHVLPVTAGTHTFAAVFISAGKTLPVPYYQYGPYWDYGTSYPGRIFRIWDRGVA